MKPIEMRTFNAEIRADGDNKKINGIASVFNVLSDDLGGFREIIDSNSFGNLIYENDVKALINHDPNLLLGRNQKSRTLKLVEDNAGLRFEVDPPNTSYANDLLVSMERGDIDQCSFAFRVLDATWELVNGQDVRHIHKFEELLDVSIVTYPAFPQTNAQVNGKDVTSPEKIYAEYRSKQSQNEDIKKQKDLDLAKSTAEKEFRDRNLSILSL